MKTVRKTSIFPAKRDEVFFKLQKLSTLRFIAAPYATFTPVNAVQSATWTVGSTSAYRFRLFGFIPFGTHTIYIERFDRDCIRSRESNEHVPVWNHKIYLKDCGSGTEYTDEVDIEAGWKTVFIWLWANAFYAHRQKKWLRLLKENKEEHMGIIKKYMNQTRKPEGILGNLMITGMNTGHTAMAKWGAEHLRVSDPAAVIDLGCGGGSNVKALAGRYTKAKVTGLDYSELSVERSRAYNSSLINSGRCEIIRGDVSEIDLPDGSFDLATAFETIYFWPGLEKCFREVARILGSDGTFMIVNETDGAEGISKQYEKIIDGMKVYTPEEIETALKAAGFDRVTTYRHDSKPWITVIAEKGDAAKSEITETLKPDYRNWVPVGMIKGMCAGTAALAAANAGAAVLLRDKSGKVKTGIQAALGLGLVGCAKMTEWCIMANRAFSYDGERKLSKVIVEGTAEYVNIPEDGVGLDVGCGSGALTIACAKRNPRATMVGIDRWGAEYASFSKALCERNAKAEGVSNVSFSKGDAVHLDYPDETFDAVTSNYVYHNISGVNKQELLRETLRVLKRGGTFAIHDLMSRARYGDMEGFAQQLRDEGYQEVELIHTDDGLFMSKKEATKMMLRGSTILRGVK